MNAEILCVGTEILLGDIVNTNAAYIAKELAACGVDCYYQSVVGDNAGRLSESLKLALSRADIVITTGGLGPTYDDLTKETVAACFGLGMELHQPSLDRMIAAFATSGRTLTKNNEKQAYMPTGSTIFENDRGTAPGLAIEKDGKTVVMLPGPPGEMTAMFEKQVKPFLLAKSTHVLHSHTIHIFGLGESAVEDVLHDSMLKHTNPTIAPYAKVDDVQLRVTASASDIAAADALIEPVIREITALFPDHVYGVDVGNIQTALVHALADAGRTIAVAESCTGGMVSARLTEVPGASAALICGVCSYSNQSKIDFLGVRQETLEAHGAVSEETALEMAKGIRLRSGADIGVSTTGVAGPSGGTEEKPVGLVYVAVSTAEKELVRKLSLSRRYANDRHSIRNFACLHAMHLVFREYLSKLCRE
ncbi:MAG: competence/damage-inducible protein A [Peptococcaceae bacterium]|jgi:nicotinamide-nucleotide amidase|nr:competence/damage-inducible protein A [Peptococcaceae bacterium]